MAKKVKGELVIVDKAKPETVQVVDITVPVAEPTIWGKIKAFFKKSETIFLARAEMVVGTIIVAVGAMDWSPLLNAGLDTGLSWKQVVTLGSISIARGLMQELARRRGTVEVQGRLLPIA